MLGWFSSAALSVNIWPDLATGLEGKGTLDKETFYFCDCWWLELLLEKDTVLSLWQPQHSSHLCYLNFQCSVTDKAGITVWFLQPEVKAPSPRLISNRKDLQNRTTSHPEIQNRISTSFKCHLGLHSKANLTVLHASNFTPLLWSKFKLHTWSLQKRN